MAGNCCADACASSLARGRYRRVLWLALLINLAMFGVEIGAGVRAESVSLLSDSLDFFGDAANYGVSLFVLGLGVVMRARASLAKALTMGLFGLFILVVAVRNFLDGSVPHASTMGLVGMLALLANIAVAVMLYAYRDGDSNMRSVWLCSRNDALGNIAVLLASVGVFGTGSRWPDLAVALVMSSLAISSGRSVLRQASAELRSVAGRA